MRSQDFTKNNVSYHDRLNSKAWDKNDQLRPEVRNRLMKIANIFVEYLEIPNFEVLDVVLTGSMANYNYTKFSDFDVHVVTNYADLECDDLAEAFYRAKKQLWNDYHDITVYGQDVEMYVEDTANPPKSGGVYSLLNGDWIKIPKHTPPKVDDRAVNLKVADLIKQIDVTVKTADDPEDIQRIRDKLRIMRRTSLEVGGEFAVENIAFKILRNMGYLDKLRDAYHKQQDDNLSLK